MRIFAKLNNRTALATRLGVIILAAFFLATFIAPSAFMQAGSGQVQVADPSVVLSNLPSKGKGETTKPGVAAPNDEAAKAEAVTTGLAPEVASNYVFTTATNASLTDMSAGTTQLVAANLDDVAS